MSNIEVSKNRPDKQFLVNNEIEEVLSGGSNDQKVRINKVDNTQVNNGHIKDKIELSSNKDVDIGLELLVNKEKITKKENNNNTALNLNDNSNTYGNQVIHNNTSNTNNQDTNVINLDNSPEIDFNTMMSNSKIDNDLNLDRTSRLSQSEIDAFIDNNDAAVKQPQLVTQLDMDNISNNNMNNFIEKKSHQSHQSRHSRHSKKSQGNLFNEDDRQSIGNKPVINNFQEYNYDPHKERKEKEEILWQLEKYRRLGVQGVRKYNMSSDLEEMRGEYIKIKKARELEGSIKFQRKCLVAFATGSELLNNKLDFLDFKLDGWSEQVNENINEYDEVFEELHEKYKERAKMAPELKLMFMMGGSAFMYHITNSMFKNSVPGMEDIMRQNPELMKQFANAAINQMDGEKQSAAKFFNSFTPGNDPSFSNHHPANQRPMPTPPDYNRHSGPIPIPTPSNSTGNFNNMSGVEEVTSNKSAFNNSSNKIPEPVGVDDILNELKSNTGDISDITSRTSRNGNIARARGPKRSINLNL